MNIYLIGLSGSGKTTVGKELSEKLKMNFVDTDEFINFKTELSPGDFISKYGEEAFRLKEKEALDDILKSKKEFVVATGGGLPYFNGLIDILKETGKVIYLKVSPKTSFKRIEYRGEGEDNIRPFSNSLDNVEYIYDLRKSTYEKADIIIDAERGSYYVVNEIILHLEIDKEINSKPDN